MPFFTDCKVRVCVRIHRLSSVCVVVRLHFPLSAYVSSILCRLNRTKHESASSLAKIGLSEEYFMYWSGDSNASWKRERHTFQFFLSQRQRS